MIRGVLFEDGAAAGFFSDRSVVVVDRNVRWALFQRADGAESRTLVQHTSSTRGAQLAAVLAFRNMHTSSAPVVLPHLLDAASVLELVGDHDTATWPGGPDGDAMPVKRNANGDTSVTSHDGVVSVTVSADGKLVHARWPLLLAAAGRGRPAGQYVWHEQVFPADALPGCWAFPALLALRAAGLAAPPPLEAAAAAAERIGAVDVATPLPQAAGPPPPAPPDFPSPAALSLLRPPAAARGPAPAGPGELRLPLHPPVRVDWTPADTLWRLPAGGTLALQADGGWCVEVTPCGGFVRLPRAGGDALFAAAAVPPHSAPAARRALAFHRARPAAVPPAGPAAPAPAAATPVPVSAEVREEAAVAGVGRLTAYADGRVRARFEDRTLLSLEADGACELLFPARPALRVHASRPLGAEPYVAIAVEFREWAARPPLERAARAAERAAAERRVAAELGKIERRLEASRIESAALGS